MLKLFIEFGPLVVFLMTYKYSDIFFATMLMIATTTVCLILSYLIDRKISAPLLVSGGVLIISGLITVLSGDSTYIKMKPTIVYIIFAIVLYVGTLYKHSFVKNVLGNVFEMEDQYWLKLSYRFTIFFIFMAIVNEVVWRNYSENFWVNFKVFGAIPCAVTFIMSQMPFINKHNTKPIITDTK